MQATLHAGKSPSAFKVILPWAIIACGQMTLCLVQGFEDQLEEHVAAMKELTR